MKEFVKEPAFSTSIERDGTIVFYKTLEMFSSVFYLKPDSMLICRGDMKTLTIPLTPEEREGINSPTEAIKFANGYISEKSPEWE